jgi:hypothetical protein
MKKVRKSIAEIKEEIYDTLGGITGAVKYYKRHPSAFYPDYFKTPPQPLIQNNVNVANIAVEDQSARRKLEDAFLRLIEARRASVGDPAVYVDGKRIDDHGNFIEHQPSTAEPPRGTDATRPLTDDSRPSIDEPRPPRPVFQSFVPGQTSAVALDGLDDNLSTTQRFLNWHGHGRPP